MTALAGIEWQLGVESTQSRLTSFWPPIFNDCSAAAISASCRSCADPLQSFDPRDSGRSMPDPMKWRRRQAKAGRGAASLRRPYLLFVAEGMLREGWRIPMKVVDARMATA